MPELEPADWEIEVPVELNEDEQAIAAYYAGLATDANREALNIRLETAKAQIAEIEAQLADLPEADAEPEPKPEPPAPEPVPAPVAEVETPALALVEEPVVEEKPQPKVEEKPQNAKPSRGSQTKRVDDKKKNA